MEIVTCKKVDMQQYGITTDCDVYLAHVKIYDIDKCATEMISAISDTSWINSLRATQMATFRVTSKKTIEKLVNNIKNRAIDDSLTDDFGEYMVSNTARKALETAYGHSLVPLAELLKGRLTGNEGFDFHSECNISYIIFGEAKYSASKNPYTDALTQIIGFIDNEKDLAELNILEHFVSNEAVNNCIGGIKGFTAAFSINALNPDIVLKNVLNSDYLHNLLSHKEIYLIGVEVDD
ncbi:hypothetical protein LN040_11365 [Desulfovibrio subterraneus]|uniref:hypothetical protein n=1 Tax=Desulfovibrio subterraneus TaxID=2718620 RepID=UPI0022B8E9B8|nr:hypothetical protein [Desulfovibrio subterraneus]WBF66327.1 hypothetical protein LN040_11365 [Desulfovibrio subterraneus]